MLRLLLAWRLIRILSPLLIVGLLALALGAVVRGIPSASASSQPSITRAVRGAERAIHPLIVDLRQALSHTLAGSSR
jgi:hypothetical protein